MRRLLWLLLALLLVGGALLAFLPAEFAVRMLADRLGPVRLEGVAGTVWNGRAASVLLDGQSLGALSWQLSPWPLLQGAVDADLRLDGPRYGIDGHVRRQGDRVVLEPMQLRFPAARLEPALDIPALSLQGDVTVEIERGELRGGYPASLAGTATWPDAAVSGAANASLGTLVAEFDSPPEGGRVTGSVSDRGGPLIVDGTFEAGLLGYALDVRMTPRAPDPRLREALGWLGEPQPDGSVRLEVVGRLLGPAAP